MFVTDTYHPGIFGISCKNASGVRQATPRYNLLSKSGRDGIMACPFDLPSKSSVTSFVARELGLDVTGFYVRANAAAPGVTPQMHWHVMSPGTP
jgi:hypothetical protein